MSGIVFIGDELTATGLRLAGIEVIVAPPAEVASALEAATRRARVVLLSSAVAKHVPAAVLEAALSAPEPLLAIVPEVRGLFALPDIAGRLKATLGIEAANHDAA